MSNPCAVCCISWSFFSVLVFKIAFLWYLNFGCHGEQTAMATAVFIRTQVQNYAGQYFFQNLLKNTINSPIYNFTFLFQGSKRHLLMSTAEFLFMF